MRPLMLIALPLLLGACHGGAQSVSNAANTAPAATTKPFATQDVASFDEPWAMVFLPDGRLLVTEKKGSLQLFDPKTGSKTAIGGMPAVAYGGQGGLGDIALAPDFASSHHIYFSHVEAGTGDTRGAVVERARLDPDAHRISDMQRIWTQVPKVSGEGHYSHRILFSPDGKYLYITSGERQKFDPAQDMKANLGKVIRLYPDGSVPADNPFASQGGVTAQIWTLGHRNLLGLAWDASGRLWEHEMGPKGGDELNIIVKGRNYGYPIVSEGDHYNGTPIPRHATHPEFEKPKISWTPVISPSSMVIYSGNLFPQWKGHALITGLSSQALVDVALDGDSAREAQRYDMGSRLREIEQAADGSLWILQDGKNAKLLKLTPLAK